MIRGCVLKSSGCRRTTAKLWHLQVTRAESTKHLWEAPIFIASCISIHKNLPRINALSRASGGRRHKFESIRLSGLWPQIRELSTMLCSTALSLLFMREQIHTVRFSPWRTCAVTFFFLCPGCLFFLSYVSRHASRTSG